MCHQSNLYDDHTYVMSKINHLCLRSYNPNTIYSDTDIHYIKIYIGMNHESLFSYKIWQRREPRKHLLSTSSLAEAGSASSLSGGLLSPGTGDFSQDEDDRDIESDEDSDRYEDLSSDGK